MTILCPRSIIKASKTPSFTTLLHHTIYMARTIILYLHIDLSRPEQTNTTTKTITINSEPTSKPQLILQVLNTFSTDLRLHNKKETGIFLHHNTAKLTNGHRIPKPLTVVAYATHCDRQGCIAPTAVLSGFVGVDLVFLGFLSPSSSQFFGPSPAGIELSPS